MAKSHKERVPGKLAPAGSKAFKITWSDHFLQEKVQEVEEGLD